MPAPKRVLSIMDMTTVGRASLSAALPVLSACGVQCCPLPAALFSTHTGGYEGVYSQDTSDYGFKALEHYDRQGIDFEAVQVGYLCTPGQFRLAEAALDRYKDAYKIVDPALADGGQLYSGITRETVDSMRRLGRKADLITPNITESALLLGKEPDNDLTQEGALKRLDSLAQNRSSVLITSVPGTDGDIQLAGREKGVSKSFLMPLHKLPQSYPGTGDLFTAAVVGKIVSGLSLRDAAAKAAAFVEAAIQATMDGGGEVRQGVWFEQCLHLLAGQ